MKMVLKQGGGDLATEKLDTRSPTIHDRTYYMTQQSHVLQNISLIKAFDGVIPKEGL